MTKQQAIKRMQELGFTDIVSARPGSSTVWASYIWEGRSLRGLFDPRDAVAEAETRAAAASAHAVPHGLYLTTPQALAELAARDRLAPVTVKYRGASEGRFTAAAQDVADLIEMLAATGRYVHSMWQQS